MATNMRFAQGDHLSLPVAEGVTSGDPVVVGALVGVAMTDRAGGGSASVALSGVHDLPVDGEVSTVGAPVFLTGAGAVVTSESGNVPFGHALAVKAAAVSVVPVRVSNGGAES